MILGIAQIKARYLAILRDKLPQIFIIHVLYIAMR